jgi:hypothetical protein
MIWAEPQEVRNYLTDDPDLLAGLDDAAVQRQIDMAQRRLSTMVVWWPEMDEEIDRAADEAVRASIVAAVAEVVRARREADLAATALGGAAAVEVIAGGGSVEAGSLKVAGGSRGSGGARLGSRASALPQEAIDAMFAAGLMGGGVASW